MCSNSFIPASFRYCFGRSRFIFASAVESSDRYLAETDNICRTDFLFITVFHRGTSAACESCETNKTSRFSMN